MSLATDAALALGSILQAGVSVHKYRYSKGSPEWEFPESLRTRLKQEGGRWKYDGDGDYLVVTVLKEREDGPGHEDGEQFRILKSELTKKVYDSRENWKQVLTDAISKHRPVLIQFSQGEFGGSYRNAFRELLKTGIVSWESLEQCGIVGATCLHDLLLQIVRELLRELESGNPSYEIAELVAPDWKHGNEWADFGNESSVSTFVALLEHEADLAVKVIPMPVTDSREEVAAGISELSPSERKSAMSPEKAVWLENNAYTKHLAQQMSENPTESTPEWDRLRDFIEHYVDTDDEVAVCHEWVRLRTWTPPERDTLEKEAADEGLAFDNVFPRHRLKMLRAFVIAKQIPLPPDVDDVATSGRHRAPSHVPDANADMARLADNKQAATFRLQNALENEQMAKRETAIAHRRTVLLRNLAPSKDAPDWVQEAIDWVAENGRRPGWAELERLVSRAAQTIQTSKHFGKHPRFKEAIVEALGIPSD